MLTYQVRKRVYRPVDEEKATRIFPNSVEVTFFFLPLQAFGKAAGGGKTAIKSVAAEVEFNLNTGQHSIESKEPLTPLQITIEEPERKVVLDGNRLHIFTYCESPRELDDLVQSIYYAFPILLNIEFADPPIIERVEIKIGDASFRWELGDWKVQWFNTTQELQEQRVISSWSRFDILSQPGNRRLIAALHYFHVACRLCRTGNSPWEFMAETILNLSKVLEVLFPPTGDGQTRNAARTGLRKLGYSDQEIERDFIPAMALRDYIDSAHVHLAIFKEEQLRVLQAYTDSAESAFRSMLAKLVEQMQEGLFDLAQYGSLGPRPEAIETINRLAKYFPEDTAA